jgi:cytochrome c
MSTRNHGLLASLLALQSMVCYAGELPSLGEPVSAEAIAGTDYTVMIDGAGLPAGGGDASTGAELYREHCLACHGENGTGGVSDVLVGGRGSLTTEKPVKTVGSYWPYATTLFDYIRRAMPYQSPGILSNDEIYAVTAYVLYLNGIIDERDTLNADTLAAVEMPNRDNFVWAYTPEE